MLLISDDMKQSGYMQILFRVRFSTCYSIYIALSGQNILYILLLFIDFLWLQIRLKIGKWNLIDTIQNIKSCKFHDGGSIARVAWRLGHDSSSFAQATI